MINFNPLALFQTKGKIKKKYREAKASYLNRIRFAVGTFYFAIGLSFATWASRIPDIKTALQLSDGQLGSILFTLPVGQLIIMPFSGKIVSKFGSHRVLIFSLILYVLSLTNIGLATTSLQLSLGLFIFGIFGSLANIAVNTQGVYTETLFRKNIMSSFHGMWSFAGFTGALVGLGMLALKLVPLHHFLIVTVVVLLLIAFNFSFLIKAKEKIKTKKEDKKLFIRPDSALMWLGVIGFCSMASEGVMFDWSGIYFKDIVKAPGAWVILGYTSFMIMMAAGRFIGDAVNNKFGRKRVMQISGGMISLGLFASVIFPYIIPSTIAFMIVGLGVSTIVPTVFSIAGKHPTVPAGEALTIVSGVSFLGFLVGPPVMGFVAQTFGLQISFAFIGIFGILIAFMVTKIKASA